MQTITVKKELTIEELRSKSWGSAPAIIQRLTDSEIELIFFTLEEISEGKPYTETEINDFFWFEDEQIEEIIGRKIIWEKESAPESDEEMEIIKGASELYDNMIKELQTTDLDIMNADKRLLVRAYIDRELEHTDRDSFLGENYVEIRRYMLKIFKERW